MAELELDRARTALLCADVQQFTVQHMAAPRRDALLAAIRRAMDGARQAVVPVIYVVAERRADFSSARNKFTRGRAAPSANADAANRSLSA